MTPLAVTSGSLHPTLGWGPQDQYHSGATLDLPGTWGHICVASSSCSTSSDQSGLLSVLSMLSAASVQSTGRPRLEGGGEAEGSEQIKSHPGARRAQTCVHTLTGSGTRAWRAPRRSTSTDGVEGLGGTTWGADPHPGPSHRTDAGPGCFLPFDLHELSGRLTMQALAAAPSPSALCLGRALPWCRLFG